MYDCVSQDTYGQYAELRHEAEEMMKDGGSLTADIRAQRDYMDTVCRSLASRLERRRVLLITSVRFHRLAEEVGLLQETSRHTRVSFHGDVSAKTRDTDQ